ncbi:hypothetical protein ACQPZQ_32410 [Pseudonocardia sp. CA-142604]|uniref:hypothetical protein n=1 Tax=Pseudonocardia sp. CA-142604 TaxID=3240024 RepID=UPI003D90B8AA
MSTGAAAKLSVADHAAAGTPAAANVAVETRRHCGGRRSAARTQANGGSDAATGRLSNKCAIEPVWLLLIADGGTAAEPIA